MTPGSAPVLLRAADGSVTQLPVGRWLSVASQEEVAILRSITGPALDVGCGPGRHVEALARRGVIALGLDVAPAAIQLAQRRGAAVLHRSVFERVPGAGRWNTVLLFDGNIGIGGDAVALLLRIGALLRSGGRAVVEVGGPGSPTRSLLARLEIGLTATAWFPWMEVGIDSIGAIAETAGFDAIDVRTNGDRWFVTVERG